MVAGTCIGATVAIGRVESAAALGAAGISSSSGQRALAGGHVAVDPSGVFVQRLLGWAHLPWRAITDVRFEGPRTIVITTRGDGAQKIELPANSMVDPSRLAQQIVQLGPPPSTIAPAHPRIGALDRSGRSREAWLSAAVEECDVRAAA